MRVSWRGFRAPAVEEFLEAADGQLDLAAERYVQHMRHFYDVRARWHRRGYRTSGIIVIGVGALLPLLATASYPHKQLIVSLAGVAVSAVTALRSFYRFDQSWILLRNTEIAISEAYLNWKLTRSEEEQAPHDIDPVERAAATRGLIDAVMRIRRDEADSYFNELPTPQPGADVHISIPPPYTRRRT
ncbi:DUF4231 domain-containing protein [Streptomyces inhibens]|uniref:DUF4231 domain-containing protein n=1 Tax=Streptomyces inhibens TaxID=2293571 RepID=UPI00369DA4DC